MIDEEIIGCDQEFFIMQVLTMCHDYASIRSLCFSYFRLVKH
jgi:hypothetical protein